MIEICPHEQCTGCTACASACPRHAVTMLCDEWGFRYPRIDAAACINCGLCTRVCPALNVPARQQRLEQERFRVARHKDESVRAASSSGGAFSALASLVLKRGGYVCGAAFSEDFHEVRHLIIHHQEELALLRTSKYLQSNMGQTYAAIKKLLNEGEEVLFSGTPCQVAGLHLFLRREYPRLTTLDIVCHGVPSPRIYSDYATWLERRCGAHLTHYNFRDKRWSWVRFNMRAEFSNGTRYYGKWETDLFYRGFLQDLYLRDCCYQCAFSKHERYADITLSDFWGVFQASRRDWLDDKGLSMCMSNTEKGEQMIQDAADYMTSEHVERKTALSNGGFNAREATREGKYAFLSLYREKGFEATIEKYRTPVPLSLKQKVLYGFGRDNFLLKVIVFTEQLPGLLRQLQGRIKGKIRYEWNRLCRKH